MLLDPQTTRGGHHVRFLFDPACPWAWRTSLWIRAVARVRPLTIQWGLLSLEFLNRDNPDNPFKELHRKSRHPLRLLAKAREVGGDAAIDRLYLAIGTARHHGERELDDEAMLREAIREAELPPELLDETREDRRLDRALEAVYQSEWERGAFGVPTIFIDHGEVPFFGPVVNPVPSDEEAGGLWDLVLGLSNCDFFYELKRSRN